MEQVSTGRRGGRPRLCGQVVTLAAAAKATVVYRGVSYHRRMRAWVAGVYASDAITGYRYRLHCGFYDDPAKAARAYDLKVLSLGFRKPLNFPEDWVFDLGQEVVVNDRYEFDSFRGRRGVVVHGRVGATVMVRVGSSVRPFLVTELDRVEGKAKEVAVAES